MYGEDSFFTLTPMGRTGLAILSVVLGVVWVYVTRRLALNRHWIVRLILALVLFAMFIWVSPQIHYSYYHLLFPDLPRQIVIGAPPSFGDLIRSLTFTGHANLSQHGKGVLGLVMIIAALLGQRRSAVVV